MALVEDGEVLGSSQLDMGISGLPTPVVKPQGGQAISAIIAPAGLLDGLIGQVQVLSPLLPDALSLRGLDALWMGILYICIVNAGYLFHRGGEVHPDGGVGSSG